MFINKQLDLDVFCTAICTLGAAFLTIGTEKHYKTLKLRYPFLRNIFLRGCVSCAVGRNPMARGLPVRAKEIIQLYVS